MDEYLSADIIDDEIVVDSLSSDLEEMQPLGDLMQMYKKLLFSSLELGLTANVMMSLHLQCMKNVTLFLPLMKITQIGNYSTRTSLLVKAKDNCKDSSQIANRFIIFHRQKSQ